MKFITTFTTLILLVLWTVIVQPAQAALGGGGIFIPGGGGGVSTTATTNIVDYSAITLATLYTNTSGSNLYVSACFTLTGAGASGQLLIHEAPPSTNSSVITTTGLTTVNQVGGWVNPGGTYQFVQNVATAAIQANSSMRVYSPLAGAVYTSGGGGTDLTVLGNTTVATMTNPANAFTGTVNATGGNVVTNQIFRGNVFYVATNGNDATALINDKRFPWGITTISNQNGGGVFLVATNPGDTIYFLAGYYTNCFNYAKVWPSVTIAGQGIGKTVFVHTNFGAPSSFVPYNNSRFKNFSWQSDFGSLFSCPFYFTNVVFENLWLHGYYDIIYPDDNSTYAGTGGECSFYNTYAESDWDIAQLSGRIISLHVKTFGCYFKALNSLTNGNGTFTSMNFPVNSTFDDFGSTFDGFYPFRWNNGTSGGITGNFSPHGSRFIHNGGDLIPLALSLNRYTQSNNIYGDKIHASSGDYIDLDYGNHYTLNGMSDLSSYTTTTNIYVTSINYTNYFTGGLSDNNGNSKYTLKSMTGTNNSSVAEWTNTQNWHLYFNDPSLLSDSGAAPPTIFISTNGTANYWFTSGNPFLRTNGFPTNLWVDLNGTPTPAVFAFAQTNSTVTNTPKTYYFYPAALNQPTNGNSLRWTNGNFYFAP